jgi:hypothetical protein
MLLQVQKGGPAPKELLPLVKAAQQTGIAPQAIAGTIIKQAHEPPKSMPTKVAHMDELKRAVVLAVQEIMQAQAQQVPAQQKKKILKVIRDKETKLITMLQEE